MPEKGRPLPPLHELRQTGNVLAGVAHCVCQPVEALLRVPGTRGARYAGVPAVLGWLFCLAFPAFHRGPDPRPMGYFFLLVTLWLLVHRVAGWLRRAHGREVHSLDSGRSILGGRESTAKSVLEPAVVIGCGRLLLGFNATLGVYLVLSGVALGVSAACQVAAENARIRNARDARLEAAWLQRHLEP